MTSTTSASTTERDALMSDLEDLWRCLDEVIASLSLKDWQRQHGKDWTFADVPYHLSYFDRDVVARPIELGDALPLDDRWLMQSGNEIDAWNASQFAKRPAGQSVEQSLEQMGASRDEIRRAVARMTDADLDRPAWSPFSGMETVGIVLNTCVAHTWNHLTELRNRLKRSGSAPSRSATHRALEFYVNFFPAMLKRDAATAPFNLVMDFPNVGVWTVMVKDGQATVRESRPVHADLVMTQSPETFSGVFTKVYNPMVAMLSRKVRVKGMRNMGRFGKLFPDPTPDQLLFPRPDGYETIKIYRN